MAEKRAVDHTNVFESYLAQDVFMLDIIEKVVHDWKNSPRKGELTRDRLEDFFYDEFQQWIGCNLEDYLNEEFEDDYGDEEE